MREKITPLHLLQPPAADGLILAGDIGGTKIDLGLFQNVRGKLHLLSAKNYSTQATRSLTDLISWFLTTELKSGKIVSACLGIAGPLIGNRVDGANLPWEVDGDELAAHFSWPRVTLLNDLVALAHAIPHLTPRQITTINAGVKSAAPGNIGLLAAGTGLGQSLLVWNGTRHLPCSSEGGHRDFAPRRGLEFRLQQFLAAIHGHVSVERVLSGEGLTQIYAFLLEENGVIPGPAHQPYLKDPRAITTAALAMQELFCRQALAIFVDLYGAEAGNLALQGLTLGGIYLGGGIAPQIIPAILEGSFMASFCAKGRMQPLLATIPVHLIVDSLATLLGAAAYAQQHR